MREVQSAHRGWPPRAATSPSNRPRRNGDDASFNSAWRGSSTDQDEDALNSSSAVDDKPEQATHWSTRTMDACRGEPHHRCAWPELSNDKHFVEKLRDVIGLYLNPPEHAMVFDEKSQIQALTDEKGTPGTMTLTSATALPRCSPLSMSSRDGHWRASHGIPRFLREIDEDLDIHLIVVLKVGSQPWLNLVERLSRNCDAHFPKCASDFLKHHNENPRPFVDKNRRPNSQQTRPPLR